MIGNVRTGSQELKNFGASKLLRPSNDGKEEWNTTLEYTAEYATAILASDLLNFSRHGIKYNITYNVV